MTINVTDVVEVAVTNPDTETVALVDPEEETEVTTPDGKVTVTFPVPARGPAPSSSALTPTRMNATGTPWTIRPPSNCWSA